MFNAGAEIRSCLCVVLFSVCSSVLEVLGGCSSERPLKRETVWTEYAQMVCAFVQNRRENSYAYMLVRLGWNLFTSELASWKNCRFHRKIADFRAI